jgi:hypothetical protein
MSRSALNSTVCARCPGVGVLWVRSATLQGRGRSRLRGGGGGGVYCQRCLERQAQLAVAWSLHRPTLDVAASSGWGKPTAGMPAGPNPENSMKGDWGIADDEERACGHYPG